MAGPRAGAWGPACCRHVVTTQHSAKGDPVDLLYYFIMFWFLQMMAAARTREECAILG